MSENVASTPPAAPGAPEPKKTNWLLIGGIVVGVLALCACAVCFGGSAILSMAGPQAGGAVIGILCGMQYPDLSSDECSAWGTDLITNHPNDYVECASQAKDSSGSTDITKLFTCLEDRGLGPND
jgi:hypothetical protein